MIIGLPWNHTHGLTNRMAYITINPIRSLCGFCAVHATWLEGTWAYRWSWRAAGWLALSNSPWWEDQLKSFDMSSVAEDLWISRPSIQTYVHPFPLRMIYSTLHHRHSAGRHASLSSSSKPAVPAPLYGTVHVEAMTPPWASQLETFNFGVVL